MNKSNESQPADASQTIEAVGQTCFYAEEQNIYKAVVTDIEGERVTLYTRANDFDAARNTIQHSFYCKEKHGHITSLMELQGVWVE